jgi:hypothetical protein
MLNALTIEEVISLKMELVYRTVGKNLYGLPLWKSMHFIVRDAMLKYISISSRTKLEAIKMLGIDSNTFYKLFNAHGLREYFNDPKEKGDGTN